MQSRTLNVLIPALGSLWPVVAAASHVVSTPEYWESQVTVAEPLTRSRVSLGMRADATSGYDGSYEVPSLGGAGIQAFFEHVDWPRGTRYAREIRGPSGPTSFELKVASIPVGKTVTVSFDLRYVPTGCERVDLYLVDLLTGGRTDIRLAGSYSFTSSDGAERVFRVEAELTTSASVPAAPVLRAVRQLSAGQVQLQWEAASGSQAYNVYRRDPGGEVQRRNDLPITSTSFVDPLADTDAVSGAYFVRAVNGDLCEGPASSAAAVQGDSRLRR